MKTMHKCLAAMVCVMMTAMPVVADDVGYAKENKNITIALVITIVATLFITVVSVMSSKRGHLD
jgi:hypothetical protein